MEFRNPLVLLFVFLTFYPGFGAFGDEDTEPSELTKAREDYENDFFRRIEPVQVRYQRELEKLQRSYTREGKLDAALEAKEELEKAERWKTIPVTVGERELIDSQLNKLLQFYEKAATAVIEPSRKRYEIELKRLKGSFSNAGELDAALKVDSELDKIQSGRILPGEIAERRYYNTFTKSEFGEWLQQQDFAFKGKVAGLKSLEFDGKEASWGFSSYEYRLTSDRSLDIILSSSKVHKVEFSRDLSSGTFESDLGVYPIIINAGQASEE